MSSPTDLYLPQTFSYPIKVVSIDAGPSTDIQRGTRLLSYSFVHLPLQQGAQPETRFGTWDSALEGSVHRWNVHPGDIVSQRKARDKPVVSVVEPCKHGMQLGGLCVLCGKDMTNSDYTGFSDASRASIQMTHSAFGPTVSLEEAQRIERETADHLLKSRKLSLIVDLDQTIVHATVDPTVGEWISEGEAWESRHAQRASTSKVNAEDSDEDTSDSDDECNPNWTALKDVKKFRLGPESFGAPGFNKGKGKTPSVEYDGRVYYIKPRPGWEEFLKDTATRYEMHVYTMGTRAYAEEVCAAIDPDGKIFGGRLLSRDESGSLTQKSLQRLFPCDTSMVVIIDDRADVWEWSPNLIKVIPYDFFIGIGDINSSFLPKIEPLTPSSASQTPTETPSPPPANSPPSEDTSPPSEEEAQRAKLETKAMLTQNSIALEAQVEARPLAKLAKIQEELEDGPPAELAKREAEVEAHYGSLGAELVKRHAETLVPSTDASSTSGLFKEEPPSGNPTQIVVPEAKDNDDNKSTSSKSEKGHRKALLRNDDYELDRISKLLDEVHRRFFSAYEARSSETGKHGKRRPTISGGKRESHKPAYDVTRIIPTIRTEVLDGVRILFSSVIPLDTRPESTEIWKMAHMFGAQCFTELTADITHVVAAKRGTVKVDAARKRGGIKIVKLAWFTDSIAFWRRQDETPYLLDDPAMGPSTSPVTNLHHLPLEPEMTVNDDEDEDWDLEENPAQGSLELAEIDWNDINDEVDAAMNESDDDDEGGDDSRSDIVSEDGMTDDTNSVASANGSANNSPNASPRLKRKRLRSVTPSDVGQNGSSPSRNDDILRSPLSKRKKLAAERTGYSKLKETISAGDLQDPSGDTDARTLGASKSSEEVGSPASSDRNGDDMEEEDDEEDDFLARELEEEWG